MANMLDQVKTIVILMFENRSFDHMLGHLSLENLHPDVDGLKQPLTNYASIHQGDTYNAFPIPSDTQLPFDVPHEWDEIEMQLAKNPITGNYGMNGFVDAYVRKSGQPPNHDSEPMGFFNSAQVPASSFLAKTYCACDRWFAALPTSTQPNRCMAFSGDTDIFFTKGRLIPVSNNNMFDWLTRAGVRWRAYHDGLSFFALYPKLWKHVLSHRFRDYEYLVKDIMQEPADEAPEVIIIEPSYQDAPHVGSDRPNDNHAPLAIGWGEEFLRRTYEALTSNEEKWKHTVFIVYYDEHGGFYDHVVPPSIPYTTKGDDAKTFETLGLRIPGIIASPLVKPGNASHLLFDHTSVLQLLAEKFTAGVPYSDTVKQRAQAGIKSISAALNNERYWAPPPPPSQPIAVQSVLGKTIATAPHSEMAASFEVAANEMLTQQPEATTEKYPELLLWKKAVENARSQPPF